MSVGSRLANRRRFLRGIAGGAAVSVGLPFLECFLNTSGDALAATGAPLPTRFGTWFWGCSLTPGRWEPKIIGPNYQMSEQLKPLEPFKDKLSILSGFKVYLDGNAPQPHATGIHGVFWGNVSKQPGASIDAVIADAIGSTTRFRSIEASAMGNPMHTVSRRSASVVNASETSPLSLYTRLFGPDFKDPNAADFKPDPRVMAEKSVLSAIKESHERFARDLGATDRARLDEYFTSLRQLEQEMSLQLEKPSPLEACTVPDKPGEGPTGTDVEVVMANHKLFAKLFAHALACDQTRVVNMSFTDGPSSLRKTGDPATHHIRTHEDPIDEKLGYQPQVAWFESQDMLGFADMLLALDSVREGDGTLLDRMVLFAATESGYAKEHTLDNIPMFLAGRGGGRLKAGLHISEKNEPVTRVGLTIQQALGLPVSSWGYQSLKTSKAISELIA